MTLQFSKEILDFLDLQPTALMLLDQENTIIHTNQKSRDLFRVANIQELSNTIIEELTSCKSTKSGFYKKNIHFQDENNDEQIIQCIYTKYLEKYILITLREVTKEVNLIQDYLLLNKELKAKNIIRNIKEQELELIQDRLKKIYKYNPDDLIFIDKNFIVHSFSSNLPQKQAIKGKSKCYELLGFSNFCPNCPLQNGFSNEKLTVGHTINNNYILENIIPFSKEQGALIVLQDNTRKINLIEKIKTHKEIIDQQKELLSNVVDLLNMMMQKGMSVNKISDQFLHHILEQCKASSAILLVTGQRTGNLWIYKTIFVENAKKEELAGEFIRISLRSKNRFFLSDKVLPTPRSKWIQTPILDNKETQLGLLILDMEATEEMSQILTLYCDPIGSFYSNCLLTKKLEMMANTDDLTGLYNRNYFSLAFEQEVQKYKKYKIHFACIVGDANGLKPINDKYGHEVGDSYLEEISNLLKEISRESDILARVGGDEFYILMPKTDQKGGEKFLNRIQDFLKDKIFKMDPNIKIPISMSLGIASSDQYHPDNLIKYADERMYINKKEYYKKNKRKN